MRRFWWNFWIGFNRALLPFTFLIAFCIAPRLWLSDIKATRRHLRDKWDYPL